MSQAVLVLLLVGSQAAPRPEGAGAAPSPVAGPAAEGSRLVERLYSREIRAHVHHALLPKYRPGPAAPTDHHRPPPDDADLFTPDLIPVRVGPSEEWPTVLGGSLHLLDEPLFSELLGLSDRILAAPASDRPPVERIHFQNELWAVFDALHSEGTHPGRLRSLPLDRWDRLMQALGRIIRHVALENAELEALTGGAEIRHSIFERLGAAGTPVEFHTLETPASHDIAHSFRRVHRFFYWDPKLDLKSLTEQQLRGFTERTLPFSPGAVALIEEDAVVLTRSGGIQTTALPLLFKAYRVTSGSAPEFSMYRIDRTARRLTPEALRPLPADTEAWARANLPNFPGHRQKPAFRAPMAVTCRGCHGNYPLALQPSLREPDLDLFRFTESAPPFPAWRTRHNKLVSSEYAALTHYFTEAETEEARRDLPAAAQTGRSPALPAGLEWYAGGGTLLATLAFLLFRRRRSAAPAPGSLS